MSGEWIVRFEGEIGALGSEIAAKLNASSYGRRLLWKSEKIEPCFGVGENEG